MRKFYSFFLLTIGICTVTSAQFVGITGPTNQGGVNVIPASGGLNQVFVLTQGNNHFGQAKGVWATATVNLSTAFSVCANLNFGSFSESNPDPLTDLNGVQSTDRQRTGADGIAFVLSKAVSSGGTGAYVGETGEEMGYGTSFYAGPPLPNGFTPRDAIAVEFDTWQNDALNHGARPLGDPVSDHMAFMRRGSADHGTSNGINNTVTPIVNLPELEDGTNVPVKISWDPVTGLRVELTKGGVFIMSTSVADVLAALNAPSTNVNVNWGFNAGTGLAANLQTVQIVACLAACSLTVNATLPPLSCDNGNTIYLGYGPQSVTATSNQAGTTFQWFRQGTPDVMVGSGATLTPTQAGSYYVVATNGPCTASTEGTAEITVIDIRCGNNKVYVCHKLNGTLGLGTIGENSNTLCINVSAVPPHLNIHGDCLGECPNGNRPGTPGSSVQQNQDPAALVSESSVGVYPNPSRGQVQVSLTTPNPKSQVYIINSRGTVVETRSVGNARNLSFDLKKYGTGVYMIKVVTGSTEQTSKVVVQD